jgi:hypothetical protein
VGSPKEVASFVYCISSPFMSTEIASRIELTGLDSGRGHNDDNPIGHARDELGIFKTLN